MTYRLNIAVAAGLFVFGGTLATAQTAPTDVLTLDPALGRLFAPEAHSKTLYRGSGFLEGPTWVQRGRESFLIFTDIAGNEIKRWDSSGKVRTFAGEIFTGTDRDDVTVFDIGVRKMAMPGPVGTAIDAQGRVLFAGYGTRNIVRIESNGSRTVLTDRFEGKRFNTPNDLAIRSDGAIYFTDSAADKTRADADPSQGAPHTGVYLYRNGKVTLLLNDYLAPNGLAFTPDEQYLYVNDTYAKTLTRYQVRADGSIGGAAPFAT